MLSDSKAPAGVAPFAARSERFTVTSFQPTLAGGSWGRKCTPSAMLSWVSTSPSSTATSSSRPRASGPVAIRRRRSMTSASRMGSSLRGSRLFRNGVEESVDEAALALVEEGVGDIDIFGDHRADRDVRAGDQFIDADAKDRAHWPVQPFEAPTLGKPSADQAVDFGAPGVGASDDIVEEILLRLVIAGILDRRPEPVIVKFLEQPGQGRALHLLLVERLNCGEAGGGSRTGTGLAHAGAALASVLAARKGPSAAATSSPASHGAKWPAPGRRSMLRSSTKSTRPSSWTGSRAASFIPQITRVGAFTFGKARSS